MSTPPRVSRWIAAPVGLAGALVAGCSSYHDPAMTVADITVRERTADAIVLEFTIEAVNSNEVPLPLREFSYTVSLDGRAVYTGYRSPEATLRRFGTQRLKVPAVIPTSDVAVLPAGSAWCRLSGTMTYITPGELAQVLFDADVRRPTVGLVDERSVELGGR